MKRAECKRIRSERPIEVIEQEKLNRKRLKTLNVDHKKIDINVQKLRNQCEVILQLVFDPSYKLETNTKNEFIKIIIDCWCVIVQTKYYKINSAKYNFIHHVHCCLYEMIDGCAAGDLIIPQSSIARQYLLPTKKMIKVNNERCASSCTNQSYKIKPSSIKSAMKFLHVIMEEISK